MLAFKKHTKSRLNLCYAPSRATSKTKTTRKNNMSDNPLSESNIRKILERSIERVAPSAASDSICPICRLEWEENDDIVRGKRCSRHEFHFECLFEWMGSEPDQSSYRRKCPMCLGKIMTNTDFRDPVAVIVIATWLSLAARDVSLFRPGDLTAFSERLDKVIECVVERYRSSRTHSLL
jgi:hypothetical protein